MRVLEAEKADAERRNQQLKQKEAELRAQMVKAEGDAESQRAKAEALEARLAYAGSRDAGASGGSTIDISSLKRQFDGTGVQVMEREGGGATLVIASDITFNPGQADLNKKAEATLGKVVRTLKETKGVGKIRVEGHTDSDPIRKSGYRSNEDLSLARANSVHNFLIAQGIDETIVEVAGYGDEKPAASNDTPAGKAKNRRVEIVLVGGE
ncbi:MAG: OmpA family protein [Planctomycetes bacterium]|nr:OmpA family protein [Planctomycetota bacterium]